MAHFAKLNSESIVLSVEVVANEDILDDKNQESEALGVQFLTNLHGWSLWKQTSYNTLNGKYYTQDENGTRSESADQSKAFRKNFAGIGDTYDSTRDAFYNAKPYASWTLNETTCTWESPVTYPTSYKLNDPVRTLGISWDEDNTRWIAKSGEGDSLESFRWDTSTSSWVSI